MRLGNDGKTSLEKIANCANEYVVEQDDHEGCDTSAKMSEKGF